MSGGRTPKIYPTKSFQMELGFFLQNCGRAQFLKFLVHVGGNRTISDKKCTIFQNPPNSHPKMVIAWNKCLIHHFGGCFARFLNSDLSFGPSKSHFLSLEKGTFNKSAQSTKSSGNTLQNGGLDICFMRSPFWGEFNSGFEKLHICYHSWAVFPLQGPKTSKIAPCHNLAGKILNPFEMT